MEEQDDFVVRVWEDDGIIGVLAPRGGAIGLTVSGAARLAKELMEAVDYMHAGAPEA